MNGSLVLEKLVFVWVYFQIPWQHVPTKTKLEYIPPPPDHWQNSVLAPGSHQNHVKWELLLGNVESNKNLLFPLPMGMSVCVVTTFRTWFASQDWAKLTKPGRGGKLSLASIRHTPVNRPLFCIGSSLNAPFFTTLHLMTPYFWFFDQNFLAKSIFEKNLQIAAKMSKRVKIAWIICNFTPNDPSFLDLSPTEPLFCKKIVIDGPFIWCIK